MALNANNLELLLKKAKTKEKKYEWLQAAKLYQKASQKATGIIELSEVAALWELVGFCFYMAAFQSKSKTEFKDRLNFAIHAYGIIINILRKSKLENKKARIKHSEALVVHAKSWLVTSALKRKDLLGKWWNLENQVLEAYERLGDVHSVGLICSEMIEFSNYGLLWLTDHSEWVKLEKETLSLIDKAIQSLSESGDDYELAKAYLVASHRLSFSLESVENVKERRQLRQRNHEYSNKALDLSLKTGNPWLLGGSYMLAIGTAIRQGGGLEQVMEYGEKALEFGRITKDKRQLSGQNSLVANATLLLVEFLEDPDKQRESCEKARKLAQETVRLSQIINHKVGTFLGFLQETGAINWLARVETDPKKRQNVLKESIEINRHAIVLFEKWKRFLIGFYPNSSASLFLLAEIKNEIEQKRALLLEAQTYQEEFIAYQQELFPHGYGGRGLAYYNLCLVQNAIANIETNKTKKAEHLEKALVSLEKSNKLLTKAIEETESHFLKIHVWGKHGDRLGRVLQQIYQLTKEEKTRCRAIEAYKNAAEAYTRGELSAHAAESYWYIAQLEDQAGKQQKASQNYESASQAYDAASKKMPQLRGFYKDYSRYMQAWSQLEQARLNHSVEEYSEARQNYQKAAKLHESTDQWSYLAPNYSAWANMEEAESLSRNENTQQAKVSFQKALEQFLKAENTTKEKIGEITSADEKEMTQKLLQASNLRREYCQARILVEDAKLLDREGKYRQSSKSYSEAAENISKIIDSVNVEAERKELEYLAILCRAWERMATAEEQTSSESYLEAAEFFEKAKEYCITRKASLWALGNSNFCRGLAAGVNYQTTLDVQEHNKAKGYIKNAATNYLKAGYEHASDYAKGTQRLFDAYAFMNQAESELNQEKRVKQYQLAENLLQLAVGSFTKAKQPEKTEQVQQILANVREEKELAISFNEVLQAPTIVSSTSTFKAPTSTSEASVGLESFEHANVQANLVVGLKEVRVGESFCLSVEFVNAGKEPALLTRVEDFIPPGFMVTKKPEIYRLEESCLNMKGKQIAPLKLVEAKVVLQPSKKGVYQLNPKVHYLDENGQNRSLQLKSAEIKVEEIVLANRVSTGTKELDALLLGGIPEEYSVALTGAPSDERELVIGNFLEADGGVTSFCVATEAAGLENLLKKPNFYLFLCNPRPRVKVPDLPNVYKLHGKADINNLNIALAQAYRTVQQSSSKRICIENVSEVLVNYGVKTTRKWISELITDLSSKGFTMLAVIDSSMHAAEQTNAILNLFDGEITLTQTEDPLERKKALIVKKLRNQDYLKNPICLA